MRPDALRDAYARTVRAWEALRDGDLGLAEQILDDLAADLWSVIEHEERTA
jgi:hypothetical protein